MGAEFSISTSGMEGWTSEKVLPAVASTMGAWGRTWLSALVEERMNNGSTGRGVAQRTGNLARDWNSVVDSSNGAISLTVATHGIGDKYAGLQEFGGTVRPVNAKWLWIPIFGNLTSFGVARVTPTQAIAQGGFISFRRGPIFFAKPLVKTSKKDTTHGLVPLFVLKKSVYVPARLGARAFFQEKLSTLVKSIESIVAGVLNG